MQPETAKPRRTPWGLIIGLVIVVALGLLVRASWHEVEQALELLRGAQPLWIVGAVLAIAAGFLSAGQVYGRVLATLGHREPPLWLAAAAMVTILINQAVPAGSVAAYAFLVTSLRKRQLPVASVAMVAGLELLSWNGAVIIAFTYGVIYLLLTSGFNGATINIGALGGACILLGSVIFLATRTDATLHRWVGGLSAFAKRRLNQAIDLQGVERVLDEVLHSRQVMIEQPRQVGVMVLLQLTVFIFHSMALLSILHALHIAPTPFAAMAAYGLALIVSVFTVLPGGGGTVEAALTAALVAMGVPAAAALGAAVVFRLLNFWVLLPLGAFAYRALTR